MRMYEFVVFVQCRRLSTIVDAGCALCLVSRMHWAPSSNYLSCRPYLAMAILYGTVERLRTTPDQRNWFWSKTTSKYTTSRRSLNPYSIVHAELQLVFCAQELSMDVITSIVRPLIIDGRTWLTKLAVHNWAHEIETFPTISEGRGIAMVRFLENCANRRVVKTDRTIRMLQRIVCPIGLEVDRR